MSKNKNRFSDVINWDNVTEAMKDPKVRVILRKVLDHMPPDASLAADGIRSRARRKMRKSRQNEATAADDKEMGD